jgi:hypothetical protein
VRRLLWTLRRCWWIVRDFWTFDTGARVGFDFANYGALRDAGLSHREACAELNRLWLQGNPGCDTHGRVVRHAS